MTINDQKSSDDDTVLPPSPLRDSLGLVTEQQLAEALGVELVTMRGWRRDKSSPDFVRLGRAVFYRVVDVQEWVRARLTVQDRRA